MLTKQVEETGALKERIEELKSVSIKLDRAESAIEKYKQKLEEANETRKQLKVFFFIPIFPSFLPDLTLNLTVRY